MLLTKSTKRNIVLFLLAFFLCGILHLRLYRIDFTLCFPQIFCSALTVLWGITVRKRVTNDKLCRLMLLVAASTLLHLVLQILRYELFYDDSTMQRHLWYAMYIPMTAQPLLCFFLAVRIHRPKDAPLPRRYYWLIVIGAALLLGILTNDMHFLAKSFPDGMPGHSGQEDSGPLFYMINIFIYGLYAIAMGIILKKDRRYVTRRYRWIAVLPLLIGAVYFLLYPLQLEIRLFPVRIWNMGEVFGFCVIGTLEACIQTGMIPANRGYEKLFSVTDLPVVILDGAGRPVYQTDSAIYPFIGNENTKVVTYPIHGGSIEYLVDMKEVKALNQQIADATQQIEARNAYISEETRIKQERAELETRNRLYARISGIVKPQLEQIEALLGSPKPCEKKELARIAVLKAYIKRRSNMELLAASGLLSVAELASAVEESLDCVRLCGVNTASSAVGIGSYSAEMVIAAYEQVEEIVEDCLDTLSDMNTTIRSKGRFLIIRIMLRAGELSFEANEAWQEHAGFLRKSSVEREDQDRILVLTFTSGGGPR